MEIPSLLRRAEQQALAGVTLSGNVLDLGGDSRSAYRSLFQGDHTFTTVNMDEKARPDVFHDLEEALPFPDQTYDGVTLINVLEHVFAYRELLKESLRVLKPGGQLVIVVPFLFPVHPSPRDYWRFTDTTLERELALLDLQDFRITALGSGMFAARYVLLDRLLPALLRLINSLTLRFLVRPLDRAFEILARVLGKKYSRTDYALGYIVVARKHA